MSFLERMLSRSRLRDARQKLARDPSSFNYAALAEDAGEDLAALGFHLDVPGRGRTAHVFLGCTSDPDLPQEGEASGGPAGASRVIIENGPSDAVVARYRSDVAGEPDSVQDPEASQRSPDDRRQPRKRWPARTVGAYRLAAIPSARFGRSTPGPDRHCRQ